MALLPGTRLGPYEIVALLGKGGGGEVYRARDPRLGRHVAIKTLHGTFGADHVRRLELEARAAAALNHPNIVGILDVDFSGHVPYLVTELLEGDTLRSVLKRGRLELSVALNYAVQMVDALAAAHAKGIVHRDLKPENVMVLPGGRIKVLDFGLAKLVAPDHALVDDVETAPVLTKTGDVVGTPAYLAPEQARGSRVDHRTDIFSFGVVLYEMITGRAPFTADTPADSLSATLRDPAPPLPKEFARLPALEHPLQRCLAKDPDARFQSAAGLRTALEMLSLPSTPHQSSRRNAVLWLLFAVATAAIVAAVALFKPWSDSAPPEGTGSRQAGESIELSPALVASLEPLQRRVADVFKPRTVDITRADSTHVRVTTDEEILPSVLSAVRLADTFASVRFVEEAGTAASGPPAPLFSGSGQSKVRVSLAVKDAPIDAVLRLIAGSAGWPVVLDETVRGKVTLALTDVPWDLLVRACLMFLGPDLTTVRIGDVWLVSTRSRIADVTGERLVMWSIPSRTVGVRELARVFEPARTDRGVILPNSRLNAVFVADLYDAVPGYARILAAIDDASAKSVVFPRSRTDNFMGARVTADFEGRTLGEVIQDFGRIAGLNMVLEPRIAPDGSRSVDAPFSVVLSKTKWDNALDVVIRAASLAYTVGDKVVHLMPKEGESTDVLVETIRLQRESPAFFQGFTSLLSPRGAMSIEPNRRVIVIRDAPSRVMTLKAWIENIDRMRP